MLLRIRATSVIASSSSSSRSAHVLGGRVGDDDADLAAVRALVEQYLDQLRVLLGQEVERVAEQVDLALAAA